jgi:pyridoxine 4-dehydrogenase
MGPRSARDHCAGAASVSGDLVIATKGGLVRPGPDVWNRNAQPKHLRGVRGEPASLATRSDRYLQFHAPDPRVPLADSVGELVRLQKEGKIRHIGFPT